MEDQGQADHKVLGVPVGDPLRATAASLEDMSGHLLRELKHFFTGYKDLEEKKNAAVGWRPAQEAYSVIEAARAAST